MKKTLSIIWLLLVAFSFSALIHSTDADIIELGTAISTTNIFSVIFISWIIALPMLLCILIFRRYGFKGYLITLVIASIVMGIIIGLAGSTAQASNGVFISVFSVVLISIFILGIGSLPNVFLTFRKLKTV